MVFSNKVVCFKDWGKDKRMCCGQHDSFSKQQQIDSGTTKARRERVNLVQTIQLIEINYSKPGNA
jgi:hypothetical protein